MAELEYTIRFKVGTIYARYGMLTKRIGTGYDSLCQFLEALSVGRVSCSDIDTWLEFQSEQLAPDVEQQTVDVHIEVSEEVFRAIEVVTEAVPYHVLTMPEPPEIQVMDAAILDEPERELPPYRSKLHAYDKRRNYSKKSYWNRIRSRLF